MVLLKRKPYLSRPTISSRGPTFSEGGGRVQMLISIKKTHRSCDFPGEVVGPPIPPLDPHMRPYGNGT